MFQTKKINKNTVVVAHDVINICLRHSGKAYYGTEEGLLVIDGNKLVIDEDVANKYGIEIVIQKGVEL